MSTALANKTRAVLIVIRRLLENGVTSVSSRQLGDVTSRWMEETYVCCPRLWALWLEQIVTEVGYLKVGLWNTSFEVRVKWDCSLWIILMTHHSWVCNLSCLLWSVLWAWDWAGIRAYRTPAHSHTPTHTVESFLNEFHTRYWFIRNLNVSALFKSIYLSFLLSFSPTTHTHTRATPVCRCAPQELRLYSKPSLVTCGLSIRLN